MGETLRRRHNEMGAWPSSPRAIFHCPDQQGCAKKATSVNFPSKDTPPRRIWSRSCCLSFAALAAGKRRSHKQRPSTCSDQTSQYNPNFVIILHLLFGNASRTSWKRLWPGLVWPPHAGDPRIEQDLQKSTRLGLSLAPKRSAVGLRFVGLKGRFMCMPDQPKATLPKAWALSITSSEERQQSLSEMKNKRKEMISWYTRKHFIQFIFGLTAVKFVYSKVKMLAQKFLRLLHHLILRENCD